MKPLLEELRRRRVPQVLGFYMAGTFALSQAVQLLEAALHFPGWVLTVTVIGSLAAFPVVVVTAWLFDFGAHGVSRTPDSSVTGFRWSAGHVGIALVAVIALLAGGWVALRPRAQAMQRVAVLPLQNRTGDPTLESLGEIAADWITESLVRAGFVNVVDLQTTLRAGAGTSGENAANADRLVSGTIYRTNDRLIFNVRITAPNGDLIEALQSIQGAAAEPTQGLGDVRDRVVTALARAVDRRVANFEGAGDAPSYQAYESYVAGLHAYLSGDFAKARPHFERAFALDSTFLRALMWQGASAAFSAGHGEAVAAFNSLTARASELSPYDRHHLEFFKAAITYDNERAYSEALAMTNASPGSDDAARELALSALRSGRIQESISRFERLDRESGISHDWPEYFFVLTAAYDAKGDLDGALEVARSSKVHDPWALAAVGWAAAARGNTALALAMVDTVVQQTPEAAPLYRLATRLYGAGQRADAVRLWRRAGAAPARSFYSALSLYYAGEYAQAAAAADSLEVGQEPTGRLAGLRGLLAARRGNEAYARAVLDTLRREAPMASRRWQARLHAVLGEKDAAAQLLSNLIFDQNLQILTRYDPDLMPLSGYPPFEQALRLRR